MDVRRADLSDRAAVVRALARSFDADPVANYLLRSDAGRGRAFENFFDVGFRRLTLPFGETWIAGDGKGAALWTPPGRWSSFGALLSAPKLVQAVGLGRVPRVLASVNRVQARHPKAPHYYLFAIGVDPAHHGRGIGSALLREVLARCDAEGASAYLEASTHGSSRLYERHGFRVTEELPVAPDGPSVWLMWRDPVGASAVSSRS
jgi:ribosomal protein S18 acetylase RimI-like enzyme